MKKSLLDKHIQTFIAEVERNPAQVQKEIDERIQQILFFQKYNKEKLLSLNGEDIYEYLSRLWAMLLWGNKHYVVDNLIANNGLNNFKQKLTYLIWGERTIKDRWDDFRKNIKGMGPAMMSEILCKTHPDDFMLWNRRAYVGLRYLDVDYLPRYDYQLDGKRYLELCEVCNKIGEEIKKAGYPDNNLLVVDYFIWKELQVADNLSRIHIIAKDLVDITEKDIEESTFIHNDIRDKLAEIRQWLGFTTKTEQKVSEGSKVDTIWEATIGNMGRIIYVFEVQTKGSIDSLIINLLKSLNNPAVQGVVAVSDKTQLEKIKNHAIDVKDLRDKLKYWDYKDILEVHESLEFVNSSINNLGLVPQGF